MRRIDLTKKVLCNFCGCSRGRFELRPHEQYQEAESSMESELKRLRLQTRRMTGKDLEGLSFPELVLLESQLRDVLPIVQNQKKKVKLQEDERLSKQRKGAKDEDGAGRALSAPCKSSGCSSEDKPQKQDDDDGPPGTRMQREFERRNAESKESERLWLLNERMNGRKLDGMTCFELFLLERRVLDGINSVNDQKLGPITDQVARKLKEESVSLLAEQDTCSLNNDNGKYGRKNRLLFVSRKFRRFQKRYHKKNM